MTSMMDWSQWSSLQQLQLEMVIANGMSRSSHTIEEANIKELEEIKFAFLLDSAKNPSRDPVRLSRPSR